jgi:hypothetical protein
MSNNGVEEGDICGRNGCVGVIERHPTEGCSCHISPPCSACMKPKDFCPICGWELADDEVFNDFIVNVDPKTGNYRYWEPRPLDSTRIDWRSRSHSNSSMIKEGIYPEGTTSEQVRALVDGSFGGKFESFGNGKFKFIAYTD